MKGAYLSLRIAQLAPSGNVTLKGSDIGNRYR